MTDVHEAGQVRARVEAAMTRWPRAGFLPPDQQRFVDLDRALPIGFGQTNSQPSTVRDMLIALDPQPGQRVLDVGSGSGWTTALLAELVGPSGQVIGVERIPELVTFGAENLARTGMPWARIVAADPGRLGAPTDGPFDRILVSAMASAIPGELLAQLAPGGILVGPADGELRRVNAEGHEHRLGRYLFVPLVTG